MTFADQFSPMQRRALHALGYPVLEHVVAGESAPYPVDVASARPMAGTSTALPARVVITHGGTPSPILQAIGDALGPVAPTARVQRGVDALVLEAGGQAPEWQLSLDALRASPRHKAALWRVLRTMRAEFGRGRR